jgi:hypothetical protein
VVGNVALGAPANVSDPALAARQTETLRSVMRGTPRAQHVLLVDLGTTPPRTIQRLPAITRLCGTSVVGSEVRWCREYEQTYCRHQTAGEVPIS